MNRGFGGGRGAGRFHGRGRENFQYRRRDGDIDHYNNPQQFDGRREERFGARESYANQNPRGEGNNNSYRSAAAKGSDGLDTT